MNINIGDLINQSGFTHYIPGLQVKFAAPKGRVAVMLLLGDADKKAPETFDATAALNDLGWIAETERDTAQSQLAALREGLATMVADRDAEKDMKATARMQRDSVTKRLADAERRNSELVGLLRSVWECSEIKGDEWKRINFYLNPNPEAASHE